VTARVRVAGIDRLGEGRGCPVTRSLIGAGRKPFELRELDDFRAIQPHAVLAVLLRPVQSAVGEADELVTAVALHGEGREPRTDRHGADVVEVDRRDPLHDRIRGCQCHPLVVFGEEQRELVAAESEGLAALAEPRTDLREDAVPRRMPVAVVDPLEVVDVDEAERQRPRLLLRAQQLALEPLVELAVIAEPGQRIREGEPHRPQRSVRRALVQRDCE